MANLRLCIDGAVAGSGNRWNAPGQTVTGSSAATALPAAASQNPDRTYVWRSLSQTANQTLTIDADVAMSVTGSAIADPRLQNSGSVKLQWSTDSSAWTDVGTFPAADPVTGVAFLCFSVLSKRYWRLLFVNGNGAVADYAQVGYVFLGQYYETTINFDAPMDMNYTDPSTAGESDGGQKTFVQKAPYYEGTCQLSGAPQTDLDTLRSLYDIVRTTGAFFVFLDITQSWLNLLVRLTGGVKYTLADAPGVYDIALDWEEAV